MKRLFGELISGIAIFFMIVGCSQSGNKPVVYGRDTVMIRQMKYFPTTLYIDKWDTVVWINEDLVSHDITAFPNKEWTSDTIPPGGSWYKVIGANTDYFCSIHVTMKGKIVVRK